MSNSFSVALKYSDNARNESHKCGVHTSEYLSVRVVLELVQRKVMSIRALQEYTYYAKYARHNQSMKRRETWSEAVDRVKEMHLRKYPQASEEIEWAFEQVKQKKVLGSQRALQYGGRPIEIKNARMYNCFRRDTRFITKNGVRSFEDFQNGDMIEVLSHTGAWRAAVVRNYGSGSLRRIVVKRGAAEHEVWATDNHRWIERGGSFIDVLREGQHLQEGPDIFNKFTYADANPMERLYWAYGYVFGDGTCVQDGNGQLRYSMVRICKKDAEFRQRFEELGFKTSSSASLNGDFMAYTGSYLKTLPDPNVDSPSLIRAFVRGFLDADGERNSNENSPNPFLSIQQTGSEGIEFIRRLFPVAGVYLVSEVDKTGQMTPFTGPSGRHLTSQFRVFNALGKTAAHFVAHPTSDVVSGDLWCLEVEEDQSFVLDFGLATGNCTVSFCDRMRFFQEAFWLLLCGCGVGFSAQRHHVAKLPNFSDKIKINYQLNGHAPHRTYVIPDTIEGWSDALGILMASYIPMPEFAEWEGVIVDFDYSLIRPAGAPLSSGAGKAPGHEPLKKALNLIRDLLNKRISEGRTRLRPIDAYDIVMHASDAVISGGVRRSATICIFSPDDDEMATAKTGNWFNENPQRGRSNNSAMLLRSETTREEFMGLMKSVKEYGEPGFYWSDSTEQLPNPCFRGDTRIATTSGMVQIKDLFDSGKPVDVAIDNRSGRGDDLFLENKGVRVAKASKVHLTQRNASLWRLTTEHGHEIVATDNHEFPTTRGRLKLRDLREGDTLLLQSGEGVWGSMGSHPDGLILGMITGDGTFDHRISDAGTEYDSAYIDIWEDDFAISTEIEKIVQESVLDVPSMNLNRSSDQYTQTWQETQTATVKKRRIGGARLYRLLRDKLGIEDPRNIKTVVPECVWQGNREMVAGYLQGLFVTDGSVQISGSDKATTVSMRLNQSNKSLLRDVQVLLQNFGISSKIYDRRKAGLRRLPDGRGGSKMYQTKDNFELVISRPNLIVFLDKIGLPGRKGDEIVSALDRRGRDCRKPERFISTVSSIDPCGSDDVYCLYQEDTNTVIANGVVTGQCVEIGMWPVHSETGESGWQFCNLCEINGKKVKSKADFEIAARAAAIIGTLQAGYTSFDYLGKTTEEIVRREALLGVSMTGMMDNPEIIFDPKIQREMAALVIKTNEEMAAKIGINAAARTTCVKPAGTTSCILGSSSGIHPHHARRYFRRVQANYMEPTLHHFKQTNPSAVEKSVWNANGTDEVITFCVEVPDGARTKNDMSAIELLKQVQLTFKNWVTYGKVTERCAQPWLSHNVSNTINVREDEWDDVADFIFTNRESFSGVSLLPQSGDLDYPQAPFCNVLTAKEILQEYGDGALLASGLVVDGLHAFDDNLWEACDTVMGRGKQNPEEALKKLTAAAEEGKSLDDAAYESLHMALKQVDWIRRVTQFAIRYCGGDVVKCCRLMKHVNNWKTWLDLNREYREVDWTALVEEEDGTASPMAEPACAGGACELPADWLRKSSEPEATLPRVGS